MRLGDYLIIGFLTDYDQSVMYNKPDFFMVSLNCLAGASIDFPNDVIHIDITNNIYATNTNIIIATLTRTNNINKNPRINVSIHNTINIPI